MLSVASFHENIEHSHLAKYSKQELTDDYSYENWFP
jgi:hypothetical protein